MKSYNCLILDDDEIDRLMAVSFIKKFPQLNIVGICADAKSASEIIEKQKIDVLFLDIDMPDTNGLEFRKQCIDIPVCIYITAHPEHALDSFELETTDFIVKPLKFDRFGQAIKRLENYLSIREKAGLYEIALGTDSILIKEGHNQVKLTLHEIIYLEALKDYTKIITHTKHHCVLTSIGNLLKESAFKNFVRTHKSFAVQKSFVKSVSSNEIILLNQQSIPVGRSFKQYINTMLT